MGRNKIPTEIKKRKGTLEKSREVGNEMNLPQSADTPQPPDGLSDEEAKFWNHYVPQLYNANVMRLVDLTAIGDLCYWEVRLEKLKTEADDHGFYHKTPNGHLQPHPANTLLRDAQKIVDGLRAKFGLTAADRTKISTLPPQEKDPNDKYFKPR